jgi:sec-independent protein translocase protein TatA
MEMPGGWELVLVLLVVVVVFGAKRLPDTARSLGRSMRILKAETQGLRDDGAPQVTAAPPPLFDAQGRPVVLPQQVHPA